MKTTLDQIKEILARRNRQYHGEACFRCHGSGSHNSCPQPEKDPSSQSDDELLDDIEAAITIHEDLPIMTAIEKSWDTDE